MTFFILFGFAELHAQSTKGFNYQAVARDNSGATLDNTSVNLRFQIRDGSPNGTLIYQEKHTPTTNGFGLLATQIGKGVDTTLLEAVPYAKVATDMRLEDLKDVNSPSANPNQVLSWDGSTWVPADVASTAYTAGNGISITGIEQYFCGPRLGNA
ncbi:MAG: hypothetical protein AB8H47_24690 [Bacteroidia bacterium]